MPSSLDMSASASSQTKSVSGIFKRIKERGSSIVKLKPAQPCWPNAEDSVGTFYGKIDGETYWTLKDRECAAFLAFSQLVRELQSTLRKNTEAPIAIALWKAYMIGQSASLCALGILLCCTDAEYLQKAASHIDTSGTIYENPGVLIRYRSKVPMCIGTLMPLTGGCGNSHDGGYDGGWWTSHPADNERNSPQNALETTSSKLSETTKKQSPESTIADAAAAYASNSTTTTPNLEHTTSEVAEIDFICHFDSVFEDASQQERYTTEPVPSWAEQVEMDTVGMGGFLVEYPYPQSGPDFQDFTARHSWMRAHGASITTAADHLEYFPECFAATKRIESGDTVHVKMRVGGMQRATVGGRIFLSKQELLVTSAHSFTHGQEISEVDKGEGAADESMTSIGYLYYSSLFHKSPELDYALIVPTYGGPVADGVNTVIPSREGTLNFPRFTSKRDFSMMSLGTRVRSNTASAGGIWGECDNIPDFLSVPGTTALQEVYAVQFASTLAPGDSGSWVFSDNSGALHGHIVAGVPEDGLALIIPAYQVFDDLKAVFDSDNQGVMERSENASAKDSWLLQREKLDQALRELKAEGETMRAAATIEPRSVKSHIDTVYRY